MIISASNDVTIYHPTTNRNDYKNVGKHYENLKRLNILICLESENTNE